MQFGLTNVNHVNGHHTTKLFFKMLTKWYVVVGLLLLQPHLQIQGAGANVINDMGEDTETTNDSTDSSVSFVQYSQSFLIDSSFDTYPSSSSIYYQTHLITQSSFTSHSLSVQDSSLDSYNLLRSSIRMFPKSETSSREQAYISLTTAHFLVKVPSSLLSETASLPETWSDTKPYLITPSTVSTYYSTEGQENLSYNIRNVNETQEFAETNNHDFEVEDFLENDEREFVQENKDVFDYLLTPTHPFTTQILNPSQDVSSNFPYPQSYLSSLLPQETTHVTAHALSDSYHLDLYHVHSMGPKDDIYSTFESDTSTRVESTLLQTEDYQSQYSPQQSELYNFKDSLNNQNLNESEIITFSTRIENFKDELLTSTFIKEFNIPYSLPLHSPEKYEKLLVSSEVLNQISKSSPTIFDSIEGAEEVKLVSDQLKEVSLEPSENVLENTGSFFTESLIIVTPVINLTRTNKEVMFSPESTIAESASSINFNIASQYFEDNMDNTKNSPDSGDLAKVSIFVDDANITDLERNKTSRDDNSQMDNILSDIIHLLSGNVQVVRPLPNMFAANRRPPRPDSSRVNNRGPPTAISHSRTVVVFSQPNHHVTLAPAILPHSHLRPTSVQRPPLYDQPGIAHVLGISPSKIDKHHAPGVHLYKPILKKPLETLVHFPFNRDVVLVAGKPPVPNTRVKQTSETVVFPSRFINSKHSDSMATASLPFSLGEFETAQSHFIFSDESDPSVVNVAVVSDMHQLESFFSSDNIGNVSKTYEVFADVLGAQRTNTTGPAKIAPTLKSSEAGFSETDTSQTGNFPSMDIAPSNTKVPSGPITDWVPVFEHPTMKFRPISNEENKTTKGFNDEDVVIITQPIIFDLTVTNAYNGILQPSHNATISGKGNSQSLITAEEIITSMYLEPNDEMLFSAETNLSLTSIKLPVSSKNFTSLLTSFTKVNAPIDSTSTDDLYSRKLNLKISDTEQVRTSQTSKVPDKIVTVMGKGTIFEDVVEVVPTKVTTKTSVEATAPHPPRQFNNGSPLGRPIVIPVDIEEVRPFVGAINPVRRGSRPTSDGQPQFHGPPPTEYQNEGNSIPNNAHIDEDHRSNSQPVSKHQATLQTSRPPIIRNQPRPRPNVPLVRIDTCIVGDDSTCDPKMNETCKTEHGISSCHCRPGFERSFTRGPCIPVVSIMLSLKVDRMGNQKITFSPQYLDQNSEEYRIMEFEAKQALSSLFGFTAFSRMFLGVNVNRFYSIGGKLIVNATVHLEEKDSTRAQSVRLQMRQEVMHAIKARNFNIGESRLYVEGPLNPVPAIEDVNECVDSNLNDCSSKGVCLNVFGTFQCRCESGYVDPFAHDERKSGRKCSACTSNYCTNHGKCFIEKGQKVCMCQGNYIGSRCEIDSEVLGVALGASLAAIVIILLTLACLCIWNRRWKKQQQKTDVMSARSVNSNQTFSYLNKMATANAYRLTMEDRMRWAHISDIMKNQPETGLSHMNSAVVPHHHAGPSRCQSPNDDDMSWYNYNTRPRSRVLAHAPTSGNGSYYDMDFSTRETYIGPSYGPSKRFKTSNAMRPYYNPN